MVRKGFSSVDDGLVDGGVIAYGCRNIRSVNDGLAADGLIANGCGMNRNVDNVPVTASREVSSAGSQ